jgi:hypothetical protein
MYVDSDSELDTATPVVAGVVKGAVEIIEIAGNIDGVRHTAAWTDGDGACGLHAVWGRCSQAGAALYANRAREYLRNSLPDSVADFCNLQGGIFKRPFLALLRSVFDDQVMPVAETATSHGSLGGCPQWRRAIWACLPPLIQQDCLDFVAARTLKRKQVEGSITPELESFAREFFVPCHEASLIRPLCLMLEFVRAEDGIDLRAGGWQEANHQFEGSFKGPELLHPWPEAPDTTKYQALFEPSDAANTIRTSFFLWRPDSILQMLELLEAMEEDPGRRCLLARGREVVGARLQAFGNLTRPESCTLEIAWAVLREAMTEEGYYFSVQELQLFMAATRTLVDVYEYTPSPNPDVSFTRQETPRYFRSVEDTTRVNVVLDLRDDPERCQGGHFSRLWSEQEWIMQPEWPDSSSCSSNSEEASSSGDDSSSEADSGKVAEAKAAGDGDVQNPVGGNEETGSDGDEVTGAPARPSKETLPAQGSPDDEEVDYEDLDDLSDVSDNSDIFNVDVLETGSRVEKKRHWQTAEDMRMAMVENVAQLMRTYPLMPPSATDPTRTESYTDMQSCVALPVVHCAFKGCTWSADPASEKLYHWELEWLLFNHLYAKHRGATSADNAGQKRKQATEHGQGDEMRAVFEKAVQESQARNRGNAVWDRRAFLQVMSFYTAAVEEQERAHLPLVGPTNDRRMLSLVTRLANSHTIRSQICFCCDQIYSNVKSWSRHMTGGWKHMSNDHDSGQISMQKVGELLKYYARDPEGFKTSFSLARFRGQYGATNPAGDAFGASTELAPGRSDWQCKIHGFPGDADFWALCNPEDVSVCFDLVSFWGLPFRT